MDTDRRSVRYVNRERVDRTYGVELSPDGATFLAGGDLLVAASGGTGGEYVVAADHPLDVAGLDRDRVSRFIDDLEAAVPGRHAWYDGKPKGTRVVDLPHRDPPEKTPINTVDPAYGAALDAVSRELGRRTDHPVMALGALPFQWDD